jgi:hypothetical protein
MSMELRNGKFFKDGVEVKLEIGNWEQIRLLKEAASLMEGKTIPAKLVNGEIRTIMYHPKIVYHCPFCNCEKEHEFDNESDESKYKSSDVDGWEMTCSDCNNDFTIQEVQGNKNSIVLRFEKYD